jgi:hypothetical protein
MIKVSIDRQVMQRAMSGVADQIKSKIDLNRVKKICKKLYGIESIEGFEHKGADIVAIENQVGCRLDLEVRFPMSIFISTKENSDSALPVNNNIPKARNIPKESDIPIELDKPIELDDISEKRDIPEEEIDLSGFDDIQEKKLDLSEEFDHIREEELDLSGFDDRREKKSDDMGRPKEKPVIVKNNRKRQKAS